MPYVLNGTAHQGELWYKLPEDRAGAAMVENAKAIETGQEARRQENLRFAMAHGNRNLGSLYDLAAPADDRSIAPWALISAVVGTGTSMIARNHVRLQVETSGAKASLRRDAKESSRWLGGVFAANKVSQELAPSLFVWSAVCNLGLAVVRVESKGKGKRLGIDRALPDEVIVADPEVLGGQPHQGFIKRWLAKDVALALYGDTPEKRHAIERANEDCPAFQSSYRPEMVALYEGWARKGAHCVAVGDCTLQYEKWDLDFIPWAPLYIERPMAGYWGRGWAQMLFGYQCQLWELNDSIEEQIRLGASPKWLVPVGSNINPKALSNEHMGIVDYTAGQGGTAPSLVQYAAVHRDLLEERGSLWKQGLADVGMSDWGVSGENPGEISGAAMDQLRDREHGRMVTVGQEYEAFHVRLGEICLKMGHLVDDWEVQGTGPGEKGLKQVNFKRIADLIQNRPWTVEPPAPVSAFPSSPAGKRQQVERWVEKGVMTPHDATMALDLPDNDAESSLLYSLREEILEMVDDILEKGLEGYRAPEPIMVQVGGAMPAQLASKKYFEARRLGEDEDRLDLILQWIAECDTIATQIQGPAASAPALQQVDVGGATYVAPGAAAAPVADVSAPMPDMAAGMPEAAAPVDALPLPTGNLV